MPPVENDNTADASSADTEKTLLPLRFHTVYWNFCWTVCVLVLQIDMRNYFCQKSWLQNLFLNANSPRFPEHTAIHTVNVSAASGEPQAIELMPIMSSGVSVLP